MTRSMTAQALVRRLASPGKRPDHLRRAPYFIHRPLWQVRRAQPQLVVFLRAPFRIGFPAYWKEPCSWMSFEVKPREAGDTSELVNAGGKRVWQQAWARV